VSILIILLDMHFLVLIITFRKSIPLLVVLICVSVYHQKTFPIHAHCCHLILSCLFSHYLVTHCLVSTFGWVSNMLCFYEGFYRNCCGLIKFCGYKVWLQSAFSPSKVNGTIHWLTNPHLRKEIMWCFQVNVCVHWFQKDLNWDKKIDHTCNELPSKF
jgi:hypothetical protein